jgi:hypothetical protein
MKLSPVGRVARSAKLTVKSVREAAPKVVSSLAELKANAPRYAKELGNDFDVVKELVVSRGAALNPLLATLLGKAMMPSDAGTTETTHVHTHAHAAE